jgi:hypothetical protein
MMELGGTISDKLRKLFAKGDPAWNPSRSQPAPSTKAIKGARGRGLGDGANRSKGGK